MASYTTPGHIGNVHPGTDRLRHPDDGAVCRMVSKTVTATVCRGSRDDCTESTTGCGRLLQSIVMADTLAFSVPATALWIPSSGYVSGEPGGKVDAIKAVNDDTLRAYPPESGYGAPSLLRAGRNGQPALVTTADTVLIASDERISFASSQWTMWAVCELDDTHLAYGVFGPIGIGPHDGYALLSTDDASSGVYFRHSGTQLTGEQQYGFHTFAATMFDGSLSYYVDGVLQTLGSRPSLETPEDGTIYLGACGIELEGMGYPGWVYEAGVYTGRWTSGNVASWNAYAQQKYMNNETAPRAAMVTCPTRLIQREYDPNGGSDTPLIPPPPGLPG